MCNTSATVAHGILDISWTNGQACFCAAWFDTKTGPALRQSANIDFSRTVSLWPGAEGTSPAPSPTPSPAPHTGCGRRPYLQQHQLEMSSKVRDAHTRHTNTHTLFSVLSPAQGFGGSLTGAAFLVRPRGQWSV